MAQTQMDASRICVSGTRPRIDFAKLMSERQSWSVPNVTSSGRLRLCLGSGIILHGETPMDADEDILLSDALRTIESLSDVVLHRHQVRIEGTLRRLNRAGRGKDLAHRMEKQVKKLSSYFNKSPVNAISKPTIWDKADARLSDVLRGTPTSPRDKFRKGLGERSLASQFHHWELRTHGTSRLSRLAKNPDELIDVRSSRAPAFVQAVDLPNEKYVLNAIQHGTKLLYFERLSKRRAHTPLLLFFSSHFRVMPYDQLPRLHLALRRSTIITSLTSNLDHWFEQCQSLYDGK